MIDEESPLIENPCRICTEHIENPIQYCECKDDLFFHKECMEIWLNQTKTKNCDVCKSDFKLIKKYNYKKLILNCILFLPILSIIIFIGYYFIREDIISLKKSKSTIVLICCLTLYLAYNFVFRFCNYSLDYKLFLSE